MNFLKTYLPAFLATLTDGTQLAMRAPDANIAWANAEWALQQADDRRQIKRIRPMGE